VLPSPSRAAASWKRRAAAWAFPIALFLASIGGPATPVAAIAVGPAAIDVVHVTANTGVAAGGHIAIRAGEHVFHWEVHEDRWLLLTRDQWEIFRLRYGTLENRAMRAVPLDLSPDESERMRGTLLGFWSRQHGDMSRLEALGLAAEWEAHLAGAEPPSLAGAGFFAADAPGDPFALELRAAVHEARGPDALRTARDALEAKLLAPEGEEPLEEAARSAESLHHSLLLRSALVALEEARGVAPEALVDPERLLEANPTLSREERSRLSDYAAALEASVVRLLDSRRPDRGRPLLLAAARYQAVRRSLDEDRLLLLDAVPDARVVLDEEAVARHRDVVVELSHRAARGWRTARAAALGEPLDEFGYNGLEEAATGVYEMTAALREGRSIRARPVGRLVPGRPGAVDALAPDDPAPHSARAIVAAENREAYRSALAERYAYDLVVHNCATEIDALIAAALPDAGGRSLAFIPAALAQQLEWSEAGDASVEIPSHRQQRAAELAEAEGWRARLRESNTLTTTIYEGSVWDDHFLFFSDGRVWVRPALGTANLVYGFGHATFGLVTAPFDRGERVWGGLRGMFYSVPELFFFSIRKGRYNLVPEDPGADQEIARDSPG
jgi:hypothetical protein